MKTRLLTVVAGLALAAAALACGTAQDSNVTWTSMSPAALTALAVPEPVAPVPEGALLVQEARPIGYPRAFAVGIDGVLELGKGPSLSVSGDGRRVVMIDQDPADFSYAVRVLEADGQEVFSARDLEGRQTAPSYSPPPMLSPDGSRLAYVWPDRDKANLWTVRVADLETGGDALVAPEAADYWLAGWTSGGHLLVGSSSGLMLTGTDVKRMPLPVGAQPMATEVSPDGRKVAVQSGDYEQGMELWVTDVDTGQAHRVATMGDTVRRRGEGLFVWAGIPPISPTTENPPVLLKGPPPMTWSPDSTRIAYYVTHFDGDQVTNWELRVVNVETGEDVGVTQEGGWEAAWSPDGRHLAFVREGGPLGLLGPDGTVRDPGVQAEGLAWTRTGRLVAAIPSGLALVDPETGAATNAIAEGGESLAGATIWSRGAVQSPSGRYIAFATGSGEYIQGSVYVLDTETARAAVILESAQFQPVGWLSKPGS